MKSTVNTAKEPQIVAGGLLIMAVLCAVSVAKYLPVLLISLLPAFFLARTLAVGTLKEKLIRYAAVLGLTVYVLSLLVGFPPFKEGVVPAASLNEISKTIVIGWNSFMSSIGVIFKGAARQNMLPGTISQQSIQTYVLLTIPLAALLSVAIASVQKIKSVDVKSFGEPVVELWKRVIYFQVIWPIQKSIERPVLCLFASFLLSLFFGTIQKRLPVLWNIASFHLGIPVLIMFFCSLVVWVRSRLALFRMTAPIVEFVDMIAPGSFAFIEKAIMGSTAQEGVTAIGEFARKRGVFKDPKFYMTEDNLNYHVQVIGGSGAGKSNFLQLLIDSQISKGHGVIFVDLKADFETVDWIAGVALAHGCESKLRIFSMSDREISVGYNPVGTGSVNEIHSRIMQSLNWSEEYYRKAASSALSDVLLGLCEVRTKTREQFTLKTIHELLSQNEALDAFLLRNELSQENREILKARSLRLRTKEGSQEIMGLVTDLQNLVRCSGGQLLTDDALGNGSIKLMEAIQNQEIVYLLMNSMQDKESSISIGKLFLQDLISTVGRIYREVPAADRKPVTLIVDEFASFATENFIDLINRARGAKMGVVVAHQSRGDLKVVSDNFCDQLERNSNTKVIFGTDSSEDAENFAAMLGTQKTWKETIQVQDDAFFVDLVSGKKSLREVEEFIVHPNEIKRLQQGQALVVKRQRDIGYGIVNLYPAITYTFDDGAPIYAQEHLEYLRHASLESRSSEMQLRKITTDAGPQFNSSPQTFEEFA